MQEQFDFGELNFTYSAATLLECRQHYYYTPVRGRFILARATELRRKNLISAQRTRDAGKSFNS